MTETKRTPSFPRRQVLKAISLAGVSSALFGRALVAMAEDAAGAAPVPSVTREMIERAEWVSGVKLTDEKRDLLLKGLAGSAADFEKLRAVPLDNSVQPAFHVDASFAFGAASEMPGNAAHAGSGASPHSNRTAKWIPPAGDPKKPQSEEDLAYASIPTLAALLRARKVSSSELARVYFDRLERADPVLKCVINLTRPLAKEQSSKADDELMKGLARGPLHGIPYGAKDLLAVPGYPTTWGATPYKDQVRPEKATVIARLENERAVLLAKTAVGELAWGDVWYGGTTKNPWNTAQGSSGSSAGSASATSAGLVGFAIGTETWGSIVSPCTRCGVTGLRPTFGRVSRQGAMALAWTMDKIGTIARSVEDCALIFQSIHGADGLDASAVTRPFVWPGTRDLATLRKTLRIGYAKSLFEDDYTKWADTDEEKPGLLEWKALDQATLETLRKMGFNLVPIELPSKLPIASLNIILTAEAATAFDDLTRSGRDGLLVRQVADAWPTVFRQGQMIPAVEYIRANRIRTLVMQEMRKVMETVDLYVAPSFGGDNLLMCNLTGHPAVVLPNGFRASDGTPASMTFTGRLFEESTLLAVARAYQEATGFHLRRPKFPVAQP